MNATLMLPRGHSLSDGSLLRVNRLILTVAIVLLVTSTAVRGSDLQTYKQTYEEQLEVIVLTDAERLTALDREYAKALDNLLVRVKSSGDLGKTKLVLAERDRFSESGDMPATLSTVTELESLQSAVAKRKQLFEKDRSRKIVTLAAQYDGALNKLQRSFVKSDRLGDAESVEAERKRLEKCELYTAAKDCLERKVEAGSAEVAQQKQAGWHTASPASTPAATYSSSPSVGEGAREAAHARPVTTLAPNTRSTPRNIAPEAKIEVSAAGQTKHPPENMVDGIAGKHGQGEWVIQYNVAGTWIKFTWPTERVISKVILCDRKVQSGNILEATIETDGADPIKTGKLQPEGSPTAIALTPERRSSWVKITIEEVAGDHSGLSEIEIIGK